jgi:hypothetical protein
MGGVYIVRMQERHGMTKHTVGLRLVALLCGGSAVSPKAVQGVVLPCSSLYHMEQRSPARTLHRVPQYTRLGFSATRVALGRRQHEWQSEEEKRLKRTHICLQRTDAARSSSPSRCHQ